MPLVQTRGAASAQGFGEFAQAGAVNYIEGVFSCFLYTGTGAAQTITNGIDLSTKGGLTWIKRRNGANNNVLFDTSRGVGNVIASDSTTAQFSDSVSLTAFNTTGFTLGDDSGNGNVNYSASTYVSWTFREQPKFFDVVTYTGNGTAGRTVAHNLGSTPGFMIVKNTTSTTNWFCWHRTMPNTDVLRLNSTIAQYDDTTAWNSTTPTSTVFTVGTSIATNNTGDTYVAYLFAHDAGGFGLTGTDNVISCGSFTSNASGGCDVNLGYEPQWILSKSSTIAVPWAINDTMRGFTRNNTNNSNLLYANYNSAENIDSYLEPTSTGFKSSNQLQASAPYIYIAIRRGPMKVPTLGTSVFSPVLNGAGTAFNVGFVPDMNFTMPRNGTSQNMNGSRLVGNANRLETNQTGAEQSYPDTFIWNGASNTFIQNIVGGTPINLMLGRAPGFFDEVCYTGTGSALNPTHSLGVTPELKIIKSRSGAVAWIVGGSVIGGGVNFYMFLETNAIVESTNYWSSGSDSATTFSTRAGNSTSNSSGQTYVAYLFATCAGVSKVGSYTGNGTTQTINCGFGAGGARFVVLKRTDSTGNWYVYDTARGMTALTDPYLIFNNSGTFAAVEVATLGSVTTVSTGFALNSAILADINVSAGSYIFLAIA